MVKVVALKVGQLSANCFIVTDGGTKDCIIIDPGDDEEFIYKHIINNNLQVKYIILTHGHFDHVMAAYALQKQFKVSLFMNRKDKNILNSSSKSAKYFLKIKDAVVPRVDKSLKNNDVIKLGTLEFRTIESPGHTPGSICLYSKNENMVFVGDLLFENGGVGRYDFSYGDKEKLYESIQNILNLPKNTKIYSGHGNSSTVQKERKYHLTQI